jgi:hypothetical protein
MPIEYRVDHERQLVVARAVGVLTHEEMLDYQRTVFSDARAAMYNELVDMTQVQHIDVKSSSGVKEVAMISAAMDVPGAERRFAIVASDDLAFGLGRMYEAYREMQPQSRKRVGVFRTMREAMDFLEIKGAVELWDAKQRS